MKSHPAVNNEASAEMWKCFCELMKCENNLVSMCLKLCFTVTGRGFCRVFTLLAVIGRDSASVLNCFQEVSVLSYGWLNI